MYFVLATSQPSYLHFLPPYYTFIHTLHASDQLYSTVDVLPLILVADIFSYLTVKIWDGLPLDMKPIPYFQQFETSCNVASTIVIRRRNMIQDGRRNGVECVSPDY